MSIKRYTIGYDLGTSFVKASMMDEQGTCVASVSVPDREMTISVQHPGWAEQDPEAWWSNLVDATLKLKSKVRFQNDEIKGIGITYQMHGLVLVNKEQQVIRPSIIWCDSRAVAIGNEAFEQLGEKWCLRHYLNSPGNFTASKLKWVLDYEPNLTKQIDKVMLPGDFIAMKMTGEVNTTIGGLSEGILWDFRSNQPAYRLLEHYGASAEWLPELVPTFGEQGYLCKKAADELGLNVKTPITYRAGDQPNNAFSLNVLKPGELAATAGTSGVIYGVGDEASWDEQSRVNTFAHVNHKSGKPSYGTLLCINGTGIQNSWIRRAVSRDGKLSYEQMNAEAESVQPGSDGLMIFPFGNGAERVFQNQLLNASIEGLNFNLHGSGHLFRATQEGIVNALHYGMSVMKDMDIKPTVVRAGRANMFLSPVFRETFVNTTGCVLELFETDGSLGAARGAAVGAGIFASFQSAFDQLQPVDVIEPSAQKMTSNQAQYERWLELLMKKLNE